MTVRTNVVLGSAVLVLVTAIFILSRSHNDGIVPAFGHGTSTTISARNLGHGVNRPTVAVIGAAGFIGSVLFERLTTDFLLSVTGFDRAPFDFPVKAMAAHEIPDDLLHSFNAVVYLGGLTGRKACDIAYVFISVYLF
jgi:hypothetical protein